MTDSQRTLIEHAGAACFREMALERTYACAGMLEDAAICADRAEAWSAVAFSFSHAPDHALSVVGDVG